MTRFFSRSKVSNLIPLVTTLALVSTFVVTSGWFAASAQTAKTHTQTAAASTHPHIDCSNGDPRCVELHDPKAAFGHYVGHDEPANVFYSDEPGSGNHMRYELTLPTDPSADNPLAAGKSFNFELHPTFWFGMVMCATESDPNVIKTCTPDSDTNIVDPAISPAHAGNAFMELQFYPPGWVPNAAGPAGTSCDPTRWCSALNIDSFSDNPVTGQNQNAACQAAASIEPVNFAILTRDGVPQGPVSPLLATNDTFRANPQKAFFMNSGDRLQVTLQDTPHGLRTDIVDLTTHQSGFMVASAANGFAQVKFDPTGTTCDVATHNLPYDFHPMYSTSSEKTRATWTAHAFNIGFSDEIGHFQFCTGSNAITPTGNCPKGNFEGMANNQFKTDGDDTQCFPTSSSLLVQVPGCVGENDGFDGMSYQPVWPDGNTALHPTSVLFTSPLTGAHFDHNYPRTGFETDLAAVEAQTTGQCNVRTGVGCSFFPTTDLGFPADFYPFFSTRQEYGHCVWQLGGRIPGSTNDFGQNAQYGVLYPLSFTVTGGRSVSAFEDFRQIITNNCRADHD